MAYTNVWTTAAPLDTQAANQGAVDFRATKLDVMQRISSFGAGLLASRPTPEATGGTADWTGVMYWATDTKQTFRWNGTSWDDITTTIPGSNSSHFSDPTQANVTNPSGTVTLNTVTIPATFSTGSVVKISIDGIITSSAGTTPGLELNINTIDYSNFNFSINANAGFLYTVELQAITTTTLSVRGTIIVNNISSPPPTTNIFVHTGFISYVTGTPFNVLLQALGPFTGNVQTFGMSGIIV